MEPEPSATIVARSLGRKYGSREVLSGVDLDAYPGQVLGLIGPNGGGKSTLLLLFAGLVQPTEGSVVVCGQPAHELALAETGQVGMITAVPGVYPLLTGRENLRFFGSLYGLSDAEVDRRAAPLAEELGLPDDALTARAGTGSSGMQQKLSLIRALMLQPRVLLLDEPTSNLDPLSALTLFRAVRARADAGMTVVLVTHDLYAAERMCDRVASIDHRVREVVTLSGARTPPPPGRLHETFRGFEP
jgi:ABC-2 type transport system ATP-binding protein